MNTPLANKTTISSRNKMAPPSSQSIQAAATSSKVGGCLRPPSQVSRISTLQRPTVPTNHSTRLASLAIGVPKFLKDKDAPSTGKQSPLVASQIFPPKSSPNIPVTTTGLSAQNFTSNNNPTKVAPKPIPKTALKTGRQFIRPVVPNTSSRISGPQSRMTNVASLNSRSSSIVSSVSSASTAKRSITAIADGSRHVPNSNHIPETNTVRKGLAKFSNPMECQRQFQDLSLKIRKMKEVIEARESEVDQLQEQLKRGINVGVGYATVVQYFASKLKLDSGIDLLQECEDLKIKVIELTGSEQEYENKLGAIVEDYKNRLQVEHDLRNKLERELEETRLKHSIDLERVQGKHKNELEDLIKKHSEAENELKAHIEVLDRDLTTRTKEFSDLKKDYDALSSSFNKLEETLTKDKDARVKYAQEKINQLQKDVESLNSVLEMRSERIHVLEKDSIRLVELQNELHSQKDTNKTLSQQLESLNAALEKKREQFENLIVEHEKIRQELKRERKERRRMTMKTEQLEYVLNESCASESNIAFNSSLRDIDSADHLV